MKRGIFGLALVAAILGLAALFSKSASAFSFFGIKIDFSSSQTSATTDNGKTTTQHASSSYHYDSSDDDSKPCLAFKNHEYEVCTAYVANSALADLVPYYTFVHSDESFMADFANERLSSRYTGQANTDITALTHNWPNGDNEVSVPKIHILSVKSDLNTNTATLTTRESWTVKSETGQILFSENNKHQTITMHRVPSYVLHKWVVTEIK